MGSPTSHLQPTVLQHADSDISILQHPQIFIEFVGGNAAQSLFLDLGWAYCAKTQIKVGSRERQNIVRGLHQDVAQNRDRAFALNYFLEFTHLFEELLLADGEFSRVR